MDGVSFERHASIIGAHRYDVAILVRRRDLHYRAARRIDHSKWRPHSERAGIPLLVCFSLVLVLLIVIGDLLFEILHTLFEISKLRFQIPALSL